MFALSFRTQEMKDDYYRKEAEEAAALEEEKKKKKEDKKREKEEKQKKKEEEKEKKGKKKEEEKEKKGKKGGKKKWLFFHLSVWILSFLHPCQKVFERDCSVFYFNGDFIQYFVLIVILTHIEYWKQ